MDLINASRIATPINNGSTKPYYIICENGDTYAVKFQQNPQGIKAIINEYICSELAKILFLPIPEPALINITKEFLDVFGEKLSNFIGETIQPGLHFGTKKIKKVFTITSTKMIEEAVNLNVISELFIFDLFICNKDRDSNGGNLLFDKGKNEIVILDHTHVFDLGTIWSASQLNIRIGKPFEILNPDGFVYKKLIPYIEGRNPFDTILDKLTRMTKEQVWHIINNVPEEWLLNDEEKESLLSYLLDRKDRINETLPLLQPYIPRWKGGCLK